MGSVRGDDGLAGDLAKGAIAGAVATWVMGQATSYMYEHESSAAREMEDEAREGTTAYAAAAEKGADLVGQELSDEQTEQYGAGIHWALGIGAGAVYAALRGRVPAADRGAGLLYGTAFWAVVDEGANVALGLTPGPTAFPWQTHARGLTGHLAFGLATETTLRVLDRVV